MDVQLFNEIKDDYPRFEPYSDYVAKNDFVSHVKPKSYYEEKLKKINDDHFKLQVILCSVFLVFELSILYLIVREFII